MRVNLLALSRWCSDSALPCLLTKTEDDNLAEEIVTDRPRSSWPQEASSGGRIRNKYGFLGSFLAFRVLLGGFEGP